jgi:hypothetical protein
MLPLSSSPNIDDTLCRLGKLGATVVDEISPSTALRVVKIVHTAVWALFAGCIVVLPFVAWSRHFIAAAVLIAVVLVEVLILLANRFRCPLTDVAARYTADRRDNFDIYLPQWMARYNKHIFGTLFVLGVVFTVLVWRTS